MDNRPAASFQFVMSPRCWLPGLLMCASLGAVGQTTAAAVDGKQADNTNRNTFGGPSGVSQELESLDEFRDGLLDSQWSDSLLEPWFQWKRGLDQDFGLKMAVNVLMTYQQGSEDGSGGDDSGAGGIYRFQGSWDTYASEHSTGKVEWRVESRSSISGIPAPQSLGGTYTAAMNTGFPYGDDFDTDIGILSWKQTFTEQRWGYALGRMAFDVYLDASAVQTPYGGHLNRAFVLNPTLPTTGVGALGAVARGFVGEQVWIGGQVYDGNAKNGEFDLDTVQEGEYLKAIEIGWTPAFARRATDKIQLTYWEKDAREQAEVSAGSGWALTMTQQFTPELLAFLRAGDSDGGAGVAAESSVSIGFNYKPWKQRSVSLGLGWSEPSEETHGQDLRDEWVLEASYKVQLTRNFSLTPDLQWIQNPARLPQEDSLWVFGIRGILTL